MTTRLCYYCENDQLQEMPKLIKPIPYKLSQFRIRKDDDRPIDLSEVYFSDLSYREWHHNLIPYGMKLRNLVY